MAEIEAKDSGNGKKGRQKKMSTRVDFTPMVDMNMLLITFFMFCTTLSKPQSMDLTMPSNEKVDDEKKDQITESTSVTILLGADDRIFYFEGNPQMAYENPTDTSIVKETTYGVKGNGIREYLRGKNSDVYKAKEELKAKLKNDKTYTDEAYQTDLKAVNDAVKEDMKTQKNKKYPHAATVVIKLKEPNENGVTDFEKKGTSYLNLVDILDEMNICGVSMYSIVDMEEADLKLLETLTNPNGVAAPVAAESN